jgi:hypothetical protein
MIIMTMTKRRFALNAGITIIMMSIATVDATTIIMEKARLKNMASAHTCITVVSPST